MDMKRSAGILMHPTSLPGPDGVGDLGAQARRFLDRLSEAGVGWWQMLPLHPPGPYGSPYSAVSAFAGNTLLIDLDDLVERGWLTADELEGARAELEAGPADAVDFGAAGEHKRRLLDQAYSRAGQDEATLDAVAAFAGEQEGWLDDYALYAALKQAHGGASWQQWPEALVERDPDAVAAARQELAEAIGRVQFGQWLFFEQWQALLDEAAQRGIALIGDIPIFVAMDSADVWAHREIFRVSDTGEPSEVSGVPPDYFSETGQKWGNPLYDWQRLAERGYDWWIDRVRQVLSTVDVARIDHFRGFESYWAVPAEAPTAETGHWEQGPADAFFDAIRDALGEVPFIAEDLGMITDAVLELRDRQGLPGMKVIHFAFDGQPDHPFLPHTYDENFVAYTGTHDNDTTRGWYDSQPEEVRHRVRSYVGQPNERIVWGLIDSLMASRARIVVLPVQDVFEMGTEARMNNPAGGHDNWSWRIDSACLEPRAEWTRLGEVIAAHDRQDRD